jgi:transposase
MIGLIPMLGQNPTQQEQSLFSYYVNLEQRIGPAHPLREIKAVLDLSFVVPAVKSFYGRSGNVSIDPEVIVKLMFLLFYYNLASERELMEQLSYRIDFLWFLGLNLDSPIPDHSVLSKARARWGAEVFKRLFVRTVHQCVKAGLVDGRLLHVDSTMVKANASKDSLAEVPEFLAEVYRQEEGKLEILPSASEGSTDASTAAAPDPVALGEPVATVESMVEKAATLQPPTQPRLEVLEATPAVQGGPGALISKGQQVVERISLTDPDAQLARAKNNLIELLYKEHRLIDDAHGIVTAVELTRSQVHDGTQLAALTQQHEGNTQIKASGVTVSGDQHYGTIENYRFCRQQDLRAHMAPAGAHLKERGHFPIERFTYEPSCDRYRCPAGHYLIRLQDRPECQHVVYRINSPSRCAECPLRAQCTKGKAGRSLIRYYDQQPLDVQRREALGAAGRYSRKRRKHVAEGSFADANRHGSKRARWRRLWRQQIQSWMICAVQNLKVLLAKRAKGRPKAAGTVAAPHILPFGGAFKAKFQTIIGLIGRKLAPEQTKPHFQSLYILASRS